MVWHESVNIKYIDEEAALRLSPVRRDYINRFRRSGDRRRAIAASLALDRLLVKHLGLHEREVVIRRDGNGKPFLPDYPEWHFNISHSGQWGVAAISRSHVVGIDVQQLSSFDREVAQFFMSPREISDIEVLPPGERNFRFTCRWAQCEAYLKMKGSGVATLRRGTPVIIPAAVSIILPPLDGSHLLAIASESLAPA